MREGKYIILQFVYLVF